MGLVCMGVWVFSCGFALVCVCLGLPVLFLWVCLNVEMSLEFALWICCGFYGLVCLVGTVRGFCCFRVRDVVLVRFRFVYVGSCLFVLTMFVS